MVKIIKQNIDLLRLPDARKFTDSTGREWVAIPSISIEDYQKYKDNKQMMFEKNPCRVWPGKTKDGYDKRVISLDIVPYTGPNPEWGHTHLTKFFVNDPNKKNEDRISQNLILGNCKEMETKWVDYKAEGDNNASAPTQTPNQPKQTQNPSGSGNSELPF